jgi:Ran GTPase-activating protein (RanGAP) involved in mRNA processing and transport
MENYHLYEHTGAKMFDDSLTTINLMNRQLTFIDLRNIVKHLMHHPTLETLILSGNQFGDQGAVVLASLLMVNNTIHYLDISRCGITKYGFEELLLALLKNTKITKINITGNPIEGLNEIKDESTEAGNITFVLNDNTLFTDDMKTQE